MSLFLSTCRLVFFLVRQYFFLRKHFLKKWYDIHQQPSSGFTKKQYQRLFYYALQLPVMLGDSYSLLRGKRLTYDERYRMTLLCAFTPLLDDWFDKEKLEVSIITERIFYPGQFAPQHARDILAKDLLTALHQFTPKEVKWQLIAEKLLMAQDLRRSYSKEIKASTQMMGGDSVLLARMMLQPVPEQPEEEAILHLGFGVQLLDDIFDVYEDSREQLHTMPVNCGKIETLKKEYLDLMATIKSDFENLSFNRWQTSRFLAFWWSFFARALVSLEQLEQVEKKYGTDFNPLLYDRKELICDMETFHGVYKFIRFYFKFKFF